MPYFWDDGQNDGQSRIFIFFFKFQIPYASGRGAKLENRAIRHRSVFCYFFIRHNPVPVYSVHECALSFARRNHSYDDEYKGLRLLHLLQVSVKVPVSPTFPGANELKCCTTA